MRLLIRVLPVVLPFATRWVEWHEQKILRDGVPLSPCELATAASMGVAHPEKIRLMRVDRIPVLNSLLMKCIARLLPPVSANTVGLCLRYGIYLRVRYSDNRHLIAHECVHTGQYERHGSVSSFLRAYLTECMETGYPDAPLEREAISRSASLFEPPD